MRFSLLFAFCLFLAALSTVAAQQASNSGSASQSPSPTASGSGSAAASGSGSATQSGSGSAAPSGSASGTSRSGSASGSATGSAASGSASGSGSGSGSAAPSSTSKTLSSYPTAPVITDGPFAGTGVAPAPVGTGGQAQGPDDNFIRSGARALGGSVGGILAAAVAAGAWVLL
ncbi:uncharacterized protein PFL1_04518 [Pseudozyma flocculosa PF-1]|uniref:Uncharacterized protein n=2 Tax=Pseudozyma flocculosa TaxID=84751 RepID=A0A5C3FCC5_9BASI|nr:uncharacterized protein PFL1_04518 [Pseudozyma flocculosa PF-1]EPQ27773.1 hypothetical protein PFL1_04518 [Pseudozyma flocculosa PF-1]SPO41101.1 uncharacterized protein PSFLO_06583 [Pseudozyma flocculosa]